MVGNIISIDSEICEIHCCIYSYIVDSIHAGGLEFSTSIMGLQICASMVIPGFAFYIYLLLSLI